MDLWNALAPLGVVVGLGLGFTVGHLWATRTPRRPRR